MLQVVRLTLDAGGSIWPRKITLFQEQLANYMYLIIYGHGYGIFMLQPITSTTNVNFMSSLNPIGVVMPRKPQKL